MPAQLVKFPSQHLILKKNSKYVICNEQSRNALWNWRSYKKKAKFCNRFSLSHQLSNISWCLFETHQRAWEFGAKKTHNRNWQHTQLDTMSISSNCFHIIFSWLLSLSRSRLTKSIVGKQNVKQKKWFFCIFVTKAARSLSFRWYILMREMIVEQCSEMVCKYASENFTNVNWSHSYVIWQRAWTFLGHWSAKHVQIACKMK